MNAEEKLEQIRMVLEEIYSISFVAGEIGLGVDEIESWHGRLDEQLRELTGAQPTCALCGQKGDHVCF